MSTTLLRDIAPTSPPSAKSVSLPPGLRLRCPVCCLPFRLSNSEEGFQPSKCDACGFEIMQEGWIWKALAPSRESRFRQFITDYETVRAREGRGSLSSLYYLSLPQRDITGRNSWQWRIRHRSFRYLEKNILSSLERARQGGLDILDVGAGNCWLSYRLALRGHRPVAADLLLNDWDGLGAARHYFTFLKRPFPRFQAEMDRLPFDDAQFDLIIFNASFHYSEAYEETLAESSRCLRRSGTVLILDSPFYSREECGRQMVDERQAAFEKRYGTRSDSIQSCEFLTPDILEGLGRKLGVRWQVFEPWYGLGWALRPWVAKLRGRREPSKFFLVQGTTKFA